MNNLDSKIRKIARQCEIPSSEKFKRAKFGTRHDVYLSKNFVIRISRDNGAIQEREFKLLKNLQHPLIPPVYTFYSKKNLTAMIQKRLPGKPLNDVWKKLSNKDKQKIIDNLVKFVKFLRTQKNDLVYSVNNGSKYKSFADYLFQVSSKKILILKTDEQTKNLARSLEAIIKKTKNSNSSFNNSNPVLIHGDLIIHNLLTDGKNLTGVIDWEQAMYGDKSYDIARLVYYKECAKAYYDQGEDDSYEYDFIKRLMKAINKAGLVTNKIKFAEQYAVIRAFFYLTALHWSVVAEDKKNISELISNWNKKSGNR